MATSFDNHQNHPHIAPVIAAALPDHIQYDNPRLIEFAKYLLEYMEEINKSAYYINRSSLLRDIDETDDDFLTYLQAELGSSIPRRFASEPRRFYKRLVDFYRNRGTLDSIVQFFRLLYDDDVEVYYPKDDMFEPSAGVWYDRTADVLANPQLYTPLYTFTIGGSGYNSGPILRDLYTGPAGSYTYPDQLAIGGSTRTEYTGDGTTSDFDIMAWPNSLDDVWITINGELLNRTTPAYSLSTIDFNQLTTVTFDTPPDDGVDIVIVVVHKDDVDRPPMFDNPIIFINGSIAPLYTVETVANQITGKLEYIINIPDGLSMGDEVKIYRSGSFTTNDGFLDDFKKIQDSFFYQKFSYVLRTGANADVWKNAFNRLVHPAGFIFFGEILLLIELLDQVTPYIQPGFQVGGLPFPITINPVDGGASFVKTRNSAFASFIVKEYSPETQINPFGPAQHIEIVKFLYNSPIVYFGNYTFIDAINKDININMNSKVQKIVKLTGTVDLVSGSDQVVGTGTLFTSELGDTLIVIDNGDLLFLSIDSIQDDTHLTLSSNATTNLTSSDLFVQNAPTW